MSLIEFKIRLVLHVILLSENGRVLICILIRPEISRFKAGKRVFFY